MLPLTLVPAYVGVFERSAFADDDADTKQARRRFQEGVRSFDAKRYEEARVAFAQALALKPHPSIVLNLAECELALKAGKEAVAHFEEYLKAPDTTDAGRAAAQKGLEEAKKLVVAADPPPAASASAEPVSAPPPPAPTEGTLLLRSTREGTRFELVPSDRARPVSPLGPGPAHVPLCVAPCEAKVPAGSVEITSTGPDQVGGSTSLLVAAGERRMLAAKPGSKPMRYAGWSLVGLGGLGLVVSLLKTDRSDALTAGSLVAGVGGGGLVFFSRTELKDSPAPAAAMLRVNGSF